MKPYAQATHSARIVSYRSFPVWGIEYSDVVFVGTKEEFEQFQAWIRREHVADIAAHLRISPAAAGRIKKGLGQSAPYTGESRTTKWRKSDRDKDDLDF